MINLKRKLLISTLQINDELFKDSLILICEHTTSNVMGIIINKATELTHNELVNQVKNNQDTNKLTQFNEMVLDGGPLKKDQGFVVHVKSDQAWNHSKLIDNDIEITTSRDIIEAIAEHKYNDQYLIALGYCGWDNDQLENEIKRNDWLVAPNDPQIILSKDNLSKKYFALQSIGISNISHLNPNMGTA